MQRLVSGIQPTGKMHLGNWLGAVQNWVRLQSEVEAFFFIADLHSLTTLYQDPTPLRQSKLDLAMDLLAAGIDPNRACLFFQSDVPAHSELHVILSMMTPLPWLERVPTYKDKIDEIREKDLNTYGFLGYPVLQAADILIYKATAVPVGRDQLPHLELTREIARRFNHLYRPLFPEPGDQITEFQMLPGLDGRKMSKSYGNTIPLSASVDEVNRLMKSMLTDPARVRRTDPGTPEVCPVYAYHRIFNTTERCAEVASDCRSAAIGCVACKQGCADRINAQLEPVRERRAGITEASLKEILDAGAQRARAVAAVTLGEVRDAVGL